MTTPPSRFREAGQNTPQALLCGPRRLGRIVEHAHHLGVDGAEWDDALDQIEELLWADGQLPASTSWQRRAWDMTLKSASSAYSAGTTVKLTELAEQAAERYPANLYQQAYFTAWHAARFADDDAIAAAVGLSDGTSWWPIFRAREAASINSRYELDRLDLPGPARPGAPFVAGFGEQDIAYRDLSREHIGTAFASSEGEALAEFLPDDDAQNEPRAEILSRFVAELRARDDYADTIHLQNFLGRERLGLAHNGSTAATGGLAYVDFDPALETPPPAWLAKGLLPRSGIGILLGESGAGKSFAAIHSALSVAWGLPLFGAKVNQGAVLYVAAEGGKSVTRRFTAANREMASAVTAANLTRPKGSPLLDRAPIRIVHEAPDLSREGDAAPLVETIRNARAQFERDGHRLALVIVDTWHAAMGGGEENSASDAGHALKPLVAESESGDFLALIVHHPGKDSERGARGSNALPAAADAIISVTVPGHEGAKAKPSTAMRRAVVTKMRDGEAGSEFHYRLPVVQIGIDLDGDAVTTCYVQPCEPAKVDEGGLTALDRDFMGAVRRAIAEAGGGRSEFKTARLMFNAIRREANPTAGDAAHRMAWNRAVKAAVEASRICTDAADLHVWLPQGET